jgi:hypothetical protein
MPNHLIAQVILRDSLFNSHPSVASAFRSDTPNIGEVAGLILPNIMVMAGVVFLFLIVYGGYMLIIHGGQDSAAPKMQKARNAVTYGLIGFLLVVGAYFILQIITAITGINFINSPVL